MSEKVFLDTGIFFDCLENQDKKNYHQSRDKSKISYFYFTFSDR
jgi:hypothetical protein